MSSALHASRWGLSNIIFQPIVTSARLVAVVMVYFCFLNRLKGVRILELIPVLERKDEVDRKEKLLRDLGAAFVVKFLLRV